MFLDKISNTSSEITRNVEYLKRSAYPLVLYGAGPFATRIRELLLYHEIKIDHVVKSDEYYVPNSFFHNQPIERISDVLTLYHKVDIILALEDYKNKSAELLQSQKVSCCIIFDATSFQFDFGDYYNTVKEHSFELEKFYLQLADEHSRELMVAFINARISGNLEALIKLNIPNEKQYFPEFLSFSDNEVFVDCGAFDGDTVISFIQKTKEKYSKIYAFEPDKNNIEKLKKNMAPFNHIEIIEKGCFSSKNTLFFNDGQGVASFIANQGNIKIEVDTVDHIVSDKVTFIKMDIEGSELEALKGAQNTIISNTPRLAISLYHKPEDFYTIPQYIYALNEKYKFYLRHYGLFSAELVLYAIPSDSF